MHARIPVTARICGLAAWISVLFPPPGQAREETMDPAVPEELAAFDDLWNFGDPAGTEAAFRALLPEADALPDPSVALQLKTQISRTLGLQKKYDDANALLDEVESHLVSAPPVVRVRYLLERGRVLNTSGSPGKARPLFEEAWERGLAAGCEGFAVDAAHMIAIVADGDESVEWNERALDLARRSEDPRARKWQGSLLNNLGWTYHGRENYPRAMELFRGALDFRNEQGDAEDIRVAKWCVARCHRSLGETGRALEIQRELEAEHREMGTSDGYVAEEIAECLLALGRSGESRPYFRRAHELLSADPWLPDSEPERLARLLRLGTP